MPIKTRNVTLIYPLDLGSFNLSIPEELTQKQLNCVKDIFEIFIKSIKIKEE